MCVLSHSRPIRWSVQIKRAFTPKYTTKVTQCVQPRDVYSPMMNMRTGTPVMTANRISVPRETLVGVMRTLVRI